jgi:hypothetical protein
VPRAASTPEAPTYLRELTDAGREFSFAVPSRVLTTHPVMNVRLARAGMSATVARVDRVRDPTSTGELVSVMQEFCTPGPCHSLCYPQRRHASPAFCAPVGHLPTWR